MCLRHCAPFYQQRTPKKTPLKFLRHPPFRGCQVCLSSPSRLMSGRPARSQSLCFTHEFLRQKAAFYILITPPLLICRHSTRTPVSYSRRFFVELCHYFYSGLSCAAFCRFVVRDLSLYLHSGYHKTTPRTDPLPKARILGGASPLRHARSFFSFSLLSIHFFGPYFVFLHFYPIFLQNLRHPP